LLFLPTFLNFYGGQYHIIIFVSKPKFLKKFRAFLGRLNDKKIKNYILWLKGKVYPIIWGVLRFGYQMIFAEKKVMNPILSHSQIVDVMALDMNPSVFRKINIAVFLQ